MKFLSYKPAETQPTHLLHMIYFSFYSHRSILNFFGNQAINNFKPFQGQTFEHVPIDSLIYDFFMKNHQMIKKIHQFKIKEVCK